jgi:uncharacterized protein DUF5916
MRRMLCAGLVVLMCDVVANAQQPEPARKQAVAIRAPDGAVVVDGRLDEPIWRTALFISDFVQKEPDEGAAPSDPIQVAFAYDDTALYVGARMSSERAPIQSPLGRRDDLGQSEYIIVALDTYLDHRTAYGFGVTASGVRLDRYYPADAEDFDATVEPVWAARTRVEEHAWTAELWIPLSQLRFNGRNQQVWGLNVQRFVPSNNEMDYWVAVPRTEKAWASRFGELQGLTGIRPARRFELLPYVAASSTLAGNRDPRNPFDDGTNLAGRTGADLKIGFGPNLTLDVTTNPDFGQVEADPAEVNLSAYETFFTEKRPFFIEGSGLLNSRFAETYFYSRRIGAAPLASATGDFVKYPHASTIVGAAKLTGRLPSKTSIGILSAVTEAEHATTFDLASGTRSRVPVAATTSFVVGRVQQEFGRNASTAALMMTDVHRALRPGDPLASFLPRNAFTLNGDTLLRFRNGRYELSGQAGLTHIDGDAAAITRVQRNSAHYFQRPDQSYATFNPLRTRMDGGHAYVEFARTGGRHWVWTMSSNIESPEFELNDVGRLTAADGITANALLTYRETQPSRWLRNYAVNLNRYGEWNFGGNPQSNQWSPQVNLTWLNFWTTDIRFWSFGAVDSANLTRGGPLMRLEAARQGQVEVSSPAAQQTHLKAGVYYMTRRDGGSVRYLYGEAGVRPSPRWQMSLAPTVVREVDSRQYVTTLDGGAAATFGGRYIFARVDRSTLSTQFRLNYTFKPDLNVDVHAEPFAASGAYGPTGELIAAQTNELRPFDVPGTRDFNARFFRSNVVVRWEWKPGSTLFVVWQQNRAATEPVGTRASLGDMLNSIAAPGDHVLAVKTTFWLSVH